MFRQLNEKEVEQFKDYAKTHDPEPGKWELYHPVCRERWAELGKSPKCCFDHCSNQIGQWGNNAQPLMEGRCCSDCNMIVIFARLAMLSGKPDGEA